MVDRDKLTPRLGRIGNQGKASGGRALKQLKRAIARQSKPGRKSRFTGTRYGVGGAARTKGRSTQHLPGRRVRRVIVKRHIARAGKSGPGLYRAHLSYIQRDGVDRNGEGGKLYARDGEQIDAKAFLDRSEEDRHQFRIIVSPEDGAELGDLKLVTRELMAQVERDLGRELDWVAVDHHNTGHPHTHIVIRGRDQGGRDVVIARDYLLHGIREAAEDIVTRRLGPRRDLEILRARQSEVDQDRLTQLDHALDRHTKNGIVEISASEPTENSIEHHLKLARLKHLEGLSLTQKVAPGLWRMKENWREALKDLGRRGDIIRTMARTQARGDLHFAASRDPAAPPLTGSVLTSAAEDELQDTRYLLIEDFEGRVWHVPSGAFDPSDTPPEGAVVQVARSRAVPRQADRTIAAIAARSGGIWSEALHESADPEASSAFRLAHKRRLEALRRAGIAERLTDGSWSVPPDYLEKAASYEAGRGGGLRLRTLSWLSIDEQINANAETWLDESGEATGKLGDARRARLAYLRQRGLLSIDREALTDAQKTTLRQSELKRAAAKQAAMSGRGVVELQPGDQFQGRLERSLRLAQGKFAIVGNEKAFVMAPWRDGMGRQIGRDVLLQCSQSGVSWTLGIQRSRTIPF